LDDYANRAEEEKNFAKAEQIYASILQKEKSGDFPNRSWVELRLANALEEQGKLKEAEQVLRSALKSNDVHRQNHTFERKDRVTCVQNLAILYKEDQQYKNAEECFKRALTMHAEDRDESWETMLCNEDYAKLLKATGRSIEATRFDNEAKRIRDQIEGKKPFPKIQK
jgi:tetratricopeptide (TPR) repeat protein